MQLHEENRSLKHVIYSENKVLFLLFPIDFLSAKSHRVDQINYRVALQSPSNFALYITKYI